MSQPRIKIFTRSFDLRLYRLAKGLFSGLSDRQGNEITCVRLTDQSADGYFFTMLRDTSCDVAINVDEDAFITDPAAVLDLVDVLLDGGYANIGCSDGDPATTGRDSVVTNPFFNVFNLALIRTRFDRRELRRRNDDAEPYYPFFRWMAATFPTLYLPARRHADGITTIALDPKGRTLCLHTWFSRFYSMPSWIVRRIEPTQGMQKQRIDAIINEAYALRALPVPKFGPLDRLAFAGNKVVRWTVKVPQRVSRWPMKIKRRIARRKEARG
ncbi:MAG: hypothetical protein K6G79_00925 [Bacteroidales bacterium]|nr:hypothetical protein [Bacteroidales bacterium]